MNKIKGIKTIVSFIGNGTKKLVERSFKNTDINIDEALSVYKNHYLEHLADETCCYPGIENLLNQLRKLSVKCSIVTNKHEAATHEILKILKIDGFFDIILGGDSLPYFKPAPEPLLFVAEKWCMKPEEILMVGDTWTDIAAARNADMKSVYVNFGFGDVKGEKPDFFVDEAEQLLKLI